MPPTAARRGPGRPPATKSDETRRRIVSAARQVFSERGYDGATFQAIAVRADLTRPAINHYFASKRVLYREVVDQTNELVVTAGIERARRETTLLRRLAAFITVAMEADEKILPLLRSWPPPCSSRSGIRNWGDPKTTPSPAPGNS